MNLADHIFMFYYESWNITSGQSDESCRVCAVVQEVRQFPSLYSVFMYVRLNMKLLRRHFRKRSGRL